MEETPRPEGPAARTTFKVGVCESPAGWTAGSDAWREMCRTVSREAPDLFLLNEMPFGPWIAAGETFDGEAWRESVALHDEGLLRLHELGAAVVAGSRPREIEDRQVSQAVVNGKHRLSIHFSNGTVLVVEAGSDGLHARVESPSTSAAPDNSPRPTRRQLEYLTFIAKYVQRFGRAPAEADIERHFLVSAPSVNQMMQMLERRGFITRQPGVPRSTRLCIDLTTTQR